ncbi:MAG: aminotransferase class I/II-fold pyridoxal phosphate-dependent enzyme, partial [Actinomycetota bacterium]|nr:aminotransferase class I/II-fold pyridoxal phosphate-dependent enzyme [Actinomycetota bacterium]
MPARRKAASLPGGIVDLSIGTPTDPPPAGVLTALASLGDGDRDRAVRGYPPSIGIDRLRRAIQTWTADRLGAAVPVEAIAVCVGTKEFVAGVPQLLKLRTPHRDTVLYPAVSYPTYEMGAILAGLRAVPVPLDDQWRLDLSQVADAD